MVFSPNQSRGHEQRAMPRLVRSHNSRAPARILDAFRRRRRRVARGGCPAAQRLPALSRQIHLCCFGAPERDWSDRQSRRFAPPRSATRPKSAKVGIATKRPRIALLTSKPTTMAGVIALLNYVGLPECSGPGKSEHFGWRQTFLQPSGSGSCGAASAVEC